MTLISVCIRTHDRPEGLRRAVESVLAQSHGDFEIIISDDTGAAEAVSRGFRDERIRYVASPNSGSPAASIRSAFRLADGELLALLDDDDRWHEHFLLSTLAPFQQDSDLGVVFSSYYKVTGVTRLRRRLPIAEGRHDEFLAEILDKWPVAPSAAVLRRAVWEDGEQDLPLQDEALGAATIWLRAAAAGWPFYYLDRPLMEYSVHPEQISLSSSAPSREIALLERFRFTDPRCERLRRERVARARLREAGFELRAGRPGSARRTVQAARRELGSSLIGVDWRVMPGLRAAVLRRAVGRPAVLAGLLRARRRAHRSWRLERPD